jgi:hypothetical protein
VRFQRESGKPLSINDVLFVLGLTKNLIYVSALEYKGYEVTFRDGRVLIHPRGSNASMGKVLGVRKDKLYKLQFEPPVRWLVATTVAEIWGSFGIGGWLIYIMEHLRCLGRP